MREKQKNAIYLRLSMEDAVCGTGQQESNSISNQRKMLLEYIYHDIELAGQETAEFCDDGFSGTSMDRPAIQKLLKQVKQGKIGCILVKDMSRFSRDYIELGNYLNQIFPFMGVRFIAVNDHYDSREHEGSTIELDTAFQTLLYDLYSKDISVKVKAAFESKCANGEYIFGQVPFGYAKSRTIKNAVIVEEKEAEIVRYIFSLAKDGLSSTQIAKRLFEEQIPTASQLRCPKKALERERHTWSSTMIRSILNNRFYLGEMVYGKSVRKSVGSKTRIAVPREAWKIIQNHHEPLITPQIFDCVSSFRPKQSSSQEKNAAQNREKQPLTGKIYCGGCGYSMNYKPQRKGGAARHFWCRKHAMLQIPDCCIYFKADMLEEIVLNELYCELMHRGSFIKQRENLEQFHKEQLHKLKKELENCRMRYRNLQKEADNLYESYALKQMEASKYRRLADEAALQMQELSYKIEETERKYNLIKGESQQPKQDMKQLIRFFRVEELTTEAVEVFIKKVTVYKDKRVEIEWNYREGEYFSP